MYFMNLQMDIIDGLFFQFVLFSISGWLLEVTYRTIENRRFINPGFHRGPWVPLYGSAAVILAATGTIVSGMPLYMRALVYLLVTTGLEYITGEFFLLVYKKRYWDYRENFLNFRGLVCPVFSLAWVAAAFVFEFFLYPLTFGLTALLSMETVRITNVAFMSALTIDFFHTSGLRTISVDWIKSSGGKLEHYFGIRLEAVPALAVIKRTEQSLRRDISRITSEKNRLRLMTLIRGKRRFSLRGILAELNTTITKGSRKNEKR